VPVWSVADQHREVLQRAPGPSPDWLLALTYQVYLHLRSLMQEVMLQYPLLPGQPAASGVVPGVLSTPHWFEASVQPDTVGCCP